MSSSRFRDAILEEHEMLRALLARTLDVTGGAAALDELRANARRLFEQLGEHMSFEERMLPVALRDVIGWGEVLQARIAEDHGRQREELAAAVAALEAGALTLDELLGDLHAFAATLLRDMEREEGALLEADLDALAEDAQGG
jgi:hypothetical protein